MSKILIIEDEKNLARFVELELRHEKYETQVEGNGRKGLDLALNEDFDAILLDLMLPDLNGLEIARRVRQEKTTPIIMMTARDSVIDRVSGLDHGADDYIVKPFAIEELLARLRAVLRRVQIEKRAMGDTMGVQKVVHFNDLTIETANRIVHRGDSTVDLTKREYNLLMTLIENITKETVIVAATKLTHLKVSEDFRVSFLDLFCFFTCFIIFISSYHITGTTNSLDV